MDTVLLENDLAMFLPTFGIATVVVRPGTVMASGPMTVNGRKVAVEGDEKKVVVMGCPYTAGPFSIAGVGKLEIDTLVPNQKAIISSTGGKKMLLVGSQFIAKFSVMTPAQQPQPPKPPQSDPTPMYTGQGNFVSTNLKVKGT